MNNSATETTNDIDESCIRLASVMNNVRSATFGEVRDFVATFANQPTITLLLEPAEWLEEFAILLTEDRRKAAPKLRQLLFDGRCRLVLSSVSTSSPFAQPYTMEWNRLPEDGPCYAVVLPQFVLLKRRRA